MNFVNSMPFFIYFYNSFYWFYANFRYSFFSFTSIILQVLRFYFFKNMLELKKLRIMYVLPYKLCRISHAKYQDFIPPRKKQVSYIKTIYFASIIHTSKQLLLSFFLVISTEKQWLKYRIHSSF